MIDGQSLGQTPGVASLSTNTKHMVKLSKSGYHSQQIEVASVNGALSPSSLNVQMESEESAASSSPELAAAPPAAPAHEAAAPAATAPAAAAPAAEPSSSSVAASSESVTPPTASENASASPFSASEQAEAVPATPVPPPGALGDETPAHTLRKTPAAQLVMGSFHVQIGSTTLAEVRKVIGSGLMLQQGHGGKYRAWLCYTIPEGVAGAATPQRLWLVASELNGGVHVDGVDAAKLPASFSPSAACPELPPQLSAVHFDNGLWLGSTKADLLRDYGQPAVENDRGWAYSYANEGSNFIVLELLQTQIENGKVTALHAGRELKS
jgi:hypothetical protein